MAVPKKRTSSSRRNMRRSHDGLTATVNVEQCTECGEMKLRHRVCAACGMYRSRKVIQTAEEAE